jgi:hypothetical protein
VIRERGGRQRLLPLDGSAKVNKQNKEKNKNKIKLN